MRAAMAAGERGGLPGGAGEGMQPGDHGPDGSLMLPGHHGTRVHPNHKPTSIASLCLWLCSALERQVGVPPGLHITFCGDRRMFALAY